MLEFEQHCSAAVLSYVAATTTGAHGVPDMWPAQSEMVCFAFLVSALISTACYSTLPWTEWRKQQCLFLTVLEPRKSKIKMVA